MWDYYTDDIFVERDLPDDYCCDTWCMHHPAAKKDAYGCCEYHANIVGAEDGNRSTKTSTD
jgi:hypothetical protein